MRNEDLIKKFCNGGVRGSGSNLYIDGNKLINYSTTIAQIDSNGDLILNATKYSRTTSKLQNYVRQHGNVVKVVSGLDFGVRDLTAC